MFYASTLGAEISAGLLADASGNLYGTTEVGGSSNEGTVFKIAAGTNVLTTLVNFSGAANGRSPEGTLISDAAGNLYGTTFIGGSSGDGTVSKINALTNILTTLATFTGTANGENPVANLIADASGNLYGTTSGGESSNDGTVFKIAAGTNTLSTLVTFTGTANGDDSLAKLIFDSAGNLYGTTKLGGASYDSTVFKISAGTDSFSLVASFHGTAHGANPADSLYADAAGNLYGTASSGGLSGDGTIFELTATGFVIREPGTFSLASAGCIALLHRRPRTQALYDTT